MVDVIYSFGPFFVPYEIVMLIIPAVLSGVIGISLIKLLNLEKNRLIKTIKDQIIFQTTLSKANAYKVIKKNSELEKEEKEPILGKFYELCKYQKYLVYPTLLDKMAVRDLRKTKHELDLLRTSGTIGTTLDFDRQSDFNYTANIETTKQDHKYRESNTSGFG